MSKAGLAVFLAVFVGHGGQMMGQDLIFVLTGQSNMEGAGNTKQLPPDLVSMPKNIEYYLDGKKTDFSAQPNFGPEVAFAHVLSRANPDKEIRLIKFAVGATSLLAWSPEWTQEKARLTENEKEGPLFAKLLKYVRDCRGTGKTDITGVLWMQGERDARYPAAGKEYGRNLQHFVDSIRRDLKSPKAVFILGQVNPPADRYPALSEVRKAQKDAPRAIPDTLMVSTDGIHKLKDDLHYDSQGLIELGNRFAEAYVTFAGRAAPSL